MVKIIISDDIIDFYYANDKNDYDTSISRKNIIILNETIVDEILLKLADDDNYIDVSYKQELYSQEKSKKQYKYIIEFPKNIRAGSYVLLLKDENSMHSMDVFIFPIKLTSNHQNFVCQDLKYLKEVKKTLTTFNNSIDNKYSKEDNKSLIANNKYNDYLSDMIGYFISQKCPLEYLQFIGFIVSDVQKFDSNYYTNDKVIIFNDQINVADNNVICNMIKAEDLRNINDTSYDNDSDTQKYINKLLSEKNKINVTTLNILYHDTNLINLIAKISTTDQLQLKYFKFNDHYYMIKYE